MVIEIFVNLWSNQFAIPIIGYSCILDHRYRPITYDITRDKTTELRPRPAFAMCRFLISDIDFVYTSPTSDAKILSEYPQRRCSNSIKLLLQQGCTSAADTPRMFRKLLSL